MSGHTPGPWGFGRTSDDRRIVLGDSGAGSYVCSVQIHQTPRAAGLYAETEREANARLIAAAPELLEALLAIKRFGELANVSAGRDWGGSSGKKPASKDVFQFPRHLLVELDAALAKAGAS